MTVPVNRKLFSLLLSITIFSVIAVFPYVLTLQSELIEKTGLGMEIVFIVQILQSLAIFSVAIFFGLIFSKTINFRLEITEAIAEGKKFGDALRKIWGLSAACGIFAAATIYLLDIFFSRLGAGISTHQNIAPLWQKILAAFYGGIAEEVLMRLFLMTLIIWSGMKLSRQNKPSETVIIASIILTAIIFGLGHLPVTASLTKIDTLVVTRAVVLNGIGGVIFGWLFWKKGFESAVIAHFIADIFLLSLLPLIIG